MKKILFTLLTIVCFGHALVSCTEDETTVSGTAAYTCELMPVGTFKSITSNTSADTLYQTVLYIINKLHKDYDKKWEVNYSGTSMDNALIDQDKLALSYYEEGLAALLHDQETFDAYVQSRDWGRGNFKVIVNYHALRTGAVLAESQDVVFEYSSKKGNN